MIGRRSWGLYELDSWFYKQQLSRFEQKLKQKIMHNFKQEIKQMVHDFFEQNLDIVLLELPPR